MRGEGLHFLGLAEKSQPDLLGPVVFGMFRRCAEIRFFCLVYDIPVARLDDYYDF